MPEPRGSGSLPGIRAVLGAYRSEAAEITREQVEAAWAEYETARKYGAALAQIAAMWTADDLPKRQDVRYQRCIQIASDALRDAGWPADA